MNEEILKQILSELQSLNQRVGKMEQELQDTRAQMNHRFDVMEARMSRLEERVERIEERVERIEERVDRIEKRIERVEGRVTGIEEKLDQTLGLSNKVADHETDIKLIKRVLVNQ